MTPFGRRRKGGPHSLHLNAEQEDSEPGAWRQVREVGRGWTHTPSCEREQGRMCALCARMPVDEGLFSARDSSQEGIQHLLGELRGRTGAD